MPEMCKAHVFTELRQGSQASRRVQELPPLSLFLRPNTCVARCLHARHVRWKHCRVLPSCQSCPSAPCYRDKFCPAESPIAGVMGAG